MSLIKLDETPQWATGQDWSYMVCIMRDMDEHCVNWMNNEHCQETSMNTLCVATLGTRATQVEMVATATIFSAWSVQLH